MTDYSQHSPQLKAMAEEQLRWCNDGARNVYGLNGLLGSYLTNAFKRPLTMDEKRAAAVAWLKSRGRYLKGAK